jgi:hypothetical protein
VHLFHEAASIGGLVILSERLAAFAKLRSALRAAQDNRQPIAFDQAAEPASVRDGFPRLLRAKRLSTQSG